MARTIFTPGSRVTAAFLNSINQPIFDGTDEDGHRAKISDGELSDSGVKRAAYDFLNGLKKKRKGKGAEAPSPFR